MSVWKKRVNAYISVEEKMWEKRVNDYISVEEKAISVRERNEQ